MSLTPEKFRIFLVPDPLPALFMSAWFHQNKLRNDANIKNVGIYVGPENFEKFEYDAKSDAVKSQYKKPDDTVPADRAKHIDASKQALSIPLDAWSFCFARRYFSRLSKVNVSTVLAERRKRANELKEICDLFATLGIDRFAVAEIWSRDTGIDRHFFHLCPNAKAVFFEHGVSDIRNCIFEDREEQTDGGRFKFVPKSVKALVQKIRVWAYHRIENLFMHFSTDAPHSFIRVSLLADEILHANPLNQKVKKLLPAQIVSATESIKLSEAKLYQQIEGNSALILLMIIYPKPWGPNAREDQIRMLKAFEDHLLDSFDKYFQQENIKTLVFKSKFYCEEYTDQALHSYERLKQKYKITYLSEFSEKNFPAEFYLPHLRPKIMISAYSSSAFFSRKLFPELKILTYDKWFVDYSRKNVTKYFPEFDWYRPLFNQEFRFAFEKVIPEDV